MLAARAVFQNQAMPFCAARRRSILTLGWAGLCAGASQAAAQSVWRVGPQQPIQRVAHAIARAQDGDTIEVMPGVYVGDVAVIHQQRLTIRGIGERPHIQAAGQHAEGKGIWVLRGGAVTIENLAFAGARVPDGNGAGIRLERGQLQVNGCHFHDNQMGLLTGNDLATALSVDACSFSDAPVNPDALPHLLYVGRIGHFEMTRSSLRRGREGHLLKCRAQQAVITHNLLDDGPQGQASYELDLPNGGLVTLDGNTVVQGPATRNAVMLAFGAEGDAWPHSGLVMRGNTFINQRSSGGWFVRVWSDRLPRDAQVISQGNSWLGPGSLILGHKAMQQGDKTGPAPSLPSQPGFGPAAADR